MSKVFSIAGPGASRAFSLGQKHQSLKPGVAFVIVEPETVRSGHMGDGL